MAAKIQISLVLVGGPSFSVRPSCLPHVKFAPFFKGSAQPPREWRAIGVIKLTRPVCTQPCMTAARHSVTMVTRSGLGCCQNPRSLCSRMALFSNAVIPLIRPDSQKWGICWYRATCAALYQNLKSGSSLLMRMANSLALFSSLSGAKCAKGLSILDDIKSHAVNTGRLVECSLASGVAPRA
jgi:hypothetical protein